MTFFSKDKGLVQKSKYGRLYVFKFTLDNNIVVHKVGMCHSARALDRMMEVLRGFFKAYRYVPRCELRRDKKILIPRLVEKHMHGLLEEWSHTFDKKFDGSTEFFFNLDEEALLEYLDDFTYNELLVGKTVMKETELASILEAIDTVKPKKDPKLDEIPF